MFGEFSHAPELVVLLVLALLVVGSKNLPEVGRGLGEALSQFRRAMSGQPEPEDPKNPRSEGPRRSK